MSWDMPSPEFLTSLDNSLGVLIRHLPLKVGVVHSDCEDKNRHRYPENGNPPSRMRNDILTQANQKPHRAGQQSETIKPFDAHIPEQHPRRKPKAPLDCGNVRPTTTCSLQLHHPSFHRLRTTPHNSLRFNCPRRSAMPPNGPPFCNTPSLDGPQLTTTPHSIRTHHQSLYTHTPRPSNSATTPNTLQNPSRCITPSRNLPPVSISCIDFLLEICILTNTNAITRGTRKVPPTWFFDNFPQHSPPAAPDLHDSPFLRRLRFSWSPTLHHRPTPAKTPLPSQKGRKKHLTSSECSESSPPQ